MLENLDEICYCYGYREQTTTQNNHLSCRCLSNLLIDWGSTISGRNCFDIFMQTFVYDPHYTVIGEETSLQDSLVILKHSLQNSCNTSIWVSGT